MADPGLIQALDYILNRSDESSIEALAEAVVRRRRDFRAFNGMARPDPHRMAKEIAVQISSGVGLSLESMKDSVRDMAVRIIREHAPELSPKQVDELCRSWIPETGGKEGAPAVPRDMLACMVEQFVSFSRGAMRQTVDQDLRDEMGAWPERYWKAFPPVVRGIITDFLKDRITEKEFNTRMNVALDI
jgi:hypothetical protein